ncbi:MAG: aminotransferase class I/II-fold pyridoxal phosphate-dependent enzyme [Defluviitaleaceae bacterium]|nr:aminotransferase class I/II-fold pyridoxal phosphate-dependent enzyme [Defluviitaleaceae bacterium]
MKSIYEHLKEYANTDTYPFHMPGHKRNPRFLSFDINPVSIDVTEIPGTDNLQNPKGLIKDNEMRAAKIFGSDESFFLANGSTGGIISAILSSVCEGSKLIMSRNSHMSAYSAVTLGNICPVYLYPKISWAKIPTVISPEDVSSAFSAHPDAKAVFITSPTYEGIVSDIETIAKIAHEHKAILIVDEAHGAHLKFHGAFPKSALSLGADIVIQSLHKTLPSLTQSAILHIKGSRCNRRLLRQFLNMINSSSPSYILLSSIGQCLEFLENSEEAFDSYIKKLKTTRDTISGLNNLRLIDENYIEVFAYDISKLVILTNDGNGLDNNLRKNYNLQMETSADNFILAMTSVADTNEGFDRLTSALLELDKFYKNVDKNSPLEYPKPVAIIPIREALYKPIRKVRLSDAIGQITAENIAPYPPGVPICLPGELISREILEFLPKDYIFREVNIVNEN